MLGRLLREHRINPASKPQPNLMMTLRGIKENTNRADEFLLFPSPQALSVTLNPGEHRKRVPSIILTEDSFFSN